MVWIVLFGLIEVVGLVILISWLRDVGEVIPKHDPRYIFRLVHREDRAAYRRIMRRTYAVHVRDAGRAFDRFSREIGKALLPAMQRFADSVSGLFGGRKG